MTTEQLISRVAAHAGVSASIAERSLRMVLAGIGTRLDRAARGFIAEELPESLRGWLDRGDASLPIEEHLFGLARSAGHARELVASVCRALVESLSREAVEALHAAAAIAPFLGESSAPYSPPRTTRPRGLAAGHVGSDHPLTNARPDRTQSDSVAADNPHGSTKLSSVRAR